MIGKVTETSDGYKATLVRYGCVQDGRPINQNSNGSQDAFPCALKASNSLGLSPWVSNYGQGVFNNYLAYFPSAFS